MRWNARQTDEDARKRGSGKRREFAEGAVHREEKVRAGSDGGSAAEEGDRGSSGVTVPT